jgi:dolichol-phosphate mannosyltransferase
VGLIRDAGMGVLIVDDASPDGTGGRADQLAAADQAVSTLHRPAREGLGPAYAAGFEAVGALRPRVICQMDADLSHDPADLRRLVAAVDDGADVAIGSRYVPGGRIAGWSPLRRMISRGGNLYVRVLLGVRTRDATSGFRAYRPKALERLEAVTCEAAGYAFQVEMTYRAERAGMQVVEVPICFTERRFGRSKMTAAIAFEAFLLISRWGWRRLTGRLRSAA